MGIRAYKLIVLASVLFMAAIAPRAQADSAASTEYQVKAAFLYNFVKFVDWPSEKTTDGNEPVIIGIIGKDPFGRSFEPIMSKPVKGGKVVIKRFIGLEELEKSRERDESGRHPQIDSIRKCHLLFICPSEKKKLKETISLVEDHNVLTVADTKGFLESGGIINFIIEKKKVGFEISIATAKRAELKIRSQLLRLAKRIVEEEQSDEAKK
jgi:hypothetical protein